jgi:hypothetical protein
VKEGYITTWSPLQYGFVVINQEVFFLHWSEIKEGADKAVAGAKVKFEVAPALPGKRYPKAINVVVGGTL